GGETLPDVLRAAGGFRANAAVDRLTIHRILPAARRKPGPVPRAALDVALAVAAPDEPRTSTRPAQSSSARAGDADPLGGVVIPSLPLQPYDAVLILKQPDFELPRSVQLRGEVRFPGVYALRSKTDRLTDLLDRAGGVTRQAYPNGIRFFRREADAGRVGVDLPMVLRDPRYKDNLVLADGDSIYIPAYVPTVRVEGAVNAPTSVTYVAGRGLDYYLNAAGGVSFKGDKGRVFVQQPNGNIRAVHKRPLFFGTSKPAPEPGATVTVPVRDTTAQSDRGAIFGGIAQIVTA